MDSPASKELQLHSARLGTFHIPHQLNKRRKSSSTTKKKKDGVIEWPHEAPSPEQLARAGFFYKPSQDSPDNVQCFFCNVRLDGWEPSDDPVREHLAHSDWCAWAVARSVERDPDRTDLSPEERDPMSETMITARQATFTHGDGWPHEGKKGWQCKVTRMVAAGWSWDPTGDGGESDGVTCFYCNLSVDGWEPRDDPLLEHQRRAPDCTFFQLLARFHGTVDSASKTKKSKAKRKGGASSGTTGRASVQSIQSDAPTTIESFIEATVDASLAGADDSIVTTSTTASQATKAGNEKGKKKTGRPKISAKTGTAKRKAELKADVEEAATVEYPELLQPQEIQEPVLVEPKEPTKKSAAKSRKKTAQQTKKTGSLTTEDEETHADAPKKTSRARKVKPQEPQQPPNHDHATTPSFDEMPDAIAGSMNASVQLQEELDNSMDNFDEVLPAEQSTPPVVQTKSKRGLKRTSDGMPKAPSPPTVVVLDDSISSQTKPAAKSKKPRKGKTNNASAYDAEIESSSSAQQRVLNSSIENEDPLLSRTGKHASQEMIPLPESGPKKGKARPKAKKASDADLNHSSKMTYPLVGSAIFVDEPKDPQAEEMEIEAELKQMEVEQASQEIADENGIPSEHSSHALMSTGQTRDSTRQSLSRAAIEQVFAPGGNRISSLSPVRQPRRGSIAELTPSPSGSDKENNPSSTNQPSTKHAQSQIILSPTKTTKIPLAPGTPNRSPRRAQYSPSKGISHLSSNVPWTATDLDTALLQSPQPTPGRLGQAFAAAVGELSSPEKKMSVEEWVNHRAVKGEEEMKRRCEEMVAAFEREGIRGLQSLAGIDVIG